MIVPVGVYFKKYVWEIFKYKGKKKRCFFFLQLSSFISLGSVVHIYGLFCLAPSFGRFLSFFFVAKELKCLGLVTVLTFSIRRAYTVECSRPGSFTLP